MASVYVVSNDIRPIMNAINIVGQIHQFHLTQMFTMQITAMYNT